MSNPILIKRPTTKKVHSTKLEFVGRQCAVYVRSGDFDNASKLLSSLTREASNDQIPIINGMADVCVHVQSVTNKSEGCIEFIAHLLANNTRLTLGDVRTYRGEHRAWLMGVKYVADHLV